MNRYRILLILFVPVFLFGQGIYLPQDSSGFGFAFAYSSQDQINGMGLSGMYSINGLFDLGLGFSRISSDDDAHTSAKAFGPTLGINALKSKYILFSLGMGYSIATYSSEFLDYTGLKMKTNNINLYAQLFGNFRFNHSFRILPIFGVSRVYSKVYISDKYGHSDEVMENFTIYMVGTTFLIDFDLGQSIFILPSISFDDKDSAINIGIGFTIPTSVN